MQGSKTQNLGHWGEMVAGWWLEKKGYKIIKQHYTTRFGEIDLIAKDHNQVVFIEVKLRMGINSGLPEESIDFKKQKRIKKTILAYISVNSIENFRFDVISILKSDKDNKLKLRHHIAVSYIFDI